MGHEDGSGIRRMRIMMTEAHLTAPTFKSNRGVITFTIRLLLYHFLGEEDLKWFTRFGRYGLDDNQKKALIFLREAGAVNNLVFRQLSGVDTLHASAALREVRDEGIIAQKGPATRPTMCRERYSCKRGTKPCKITRRGC